MRVEPGKTYVQRLHAVVRARDARAHEARLRHALAALDLHPRGLPAQAVVCLRRLRAPLPDLSAPGILDLQRLRAWEATTSGALQTLISQAARPAQGFVPAGAECIVFADRAELLACLAADWCDGRAHTHWWWRSLFKQRDLTDAPVRLWLRELEYVPAALAQLAQRQRVVRFAQALRADETHALLAGLCARFALRELVGALTTSGLMSRAQQQTDTTAGRSEQASTAARSAPWRHIVPENQAAGLSTAQQCLLGVGLMLVRAPARLRNAGFADDVHRWLDEQSEHAQSTNATDSTEPTPVQSQSAHARTAPDVEHEPATEVTTQAKEHTHDEGNASVSPSTCAPTSDAADLDHALIRTADESGASSDTTLHAETTTAAPATDTATDGASALNCAPELGRQAQPTDAALSQFTESELSSVAGAMDEALRSYAPSYFVPAPTDTLAPEINIKTRFGGLFFLINLALFLELYGDFTAPLAPNLPLDVWDFVALTAKHLFGSRQNALRRDAVWKLLAQLAGRDIRRAPGADFAPPDEWRVPSAWLKSLPRGGAWRWTVVRGRLQVVHPAGFLILDLTRDTRAPAQQLADELRADNDLHAGKLVPVTRGVNLRGPTSRARWFERLAAYLGVRLRYALGQKSARAAVRLLCALPANVAASATHVDVQMSLRDLPVEIRLAGLDRDPGWVPAAGRFVAFHFE